MTYEELRDQIPFLKIIAYLDNASVVPACGRVLEAVNEFSLQYPLNYGVGVFPAAKEACAKVDEARAKMARFINAREASEIIFTKNTTEAINIVASGDRKGTGDTEDKTHQRNLCVQYLWLHYSGQ